MSRISLETAELFASKMRAQLQLSTSEPVNAKTILRILGILAIYRPLSETLYGSSMKSADGNWHFMLINSNSTRGRQHFTIAHELYHLYFDENPRPHFCKEGVTDEAERSANIFARAFLMPKIGVIQSIPDKEIASKSVKLTTVLKLEALYGVSHTAMLVRLKELKLISNETFDAYQGIRVTTEAALRGLDTELYKKGNDGLVIGDFGAKARELFEKDIISEGHYVELLNMIGYGSDEGEDCVGC